MNASGATTGAEGGPGQGGTYAGGAYGGGQGGSFAGGEIRDRSLTADAAKLSERLRDIRDVFNRRLNWQSGLRALRGEIETLTATASADGAALANRDRYWAPTIKSLHARLVALEKAHREIGQATEAGRREVAEALEALEEDERILLGETGTDLKKRSELLSMKVETLNRNALSLCQEIKDFWRILPSLVGKSRQLEKLITSIAAHYGKTLSTAEELRGNLARFTGRLSNTGEVRAKGRRVLDVPDRSGEYRAALGRAKTRLATLGHLVLSKASSEYHRGLAEARRRDLEDYLEREEALAAILENKDWEIAYLKPNVPSRPSRASGPIAGGRGRGRGGHRAARRWHLGEALGGHKRAGPAGRPLGPGQGALDIHGGF